MKRQNFKHLECSLARTLDVVGEWWTLLIIRDLFYGIDTFDKLCWDLGVARNILADRLNKLKEQRVIEKRVQLDWRGRKRYGLTPKGEDLFQIIMTLVAWGDRWEAPKGPPVVLWHGKNRHRGRPIVICAECGETMTPRNVKPLRGPGAKRPKALPLPLRPTKV
ncbi:MAG TPA: helix-turn-helix domain-containing protein [Syntrophales bacterium]|nr:helix-turn-helix domain-containing protein [Syntrophales bacterium]